MLVQRVLSPATRLESWTVLGDDDVPVQPIERYLAYLTSIERSPNTIKAYAHDLKDYFTFLVSRGLDWREVRLEDLGEFIAWLRRPPETRDGNVAVLPSVGHHCAESTVNRKLSALAAFYQHAARHGVDLGELLITWQPGGGRGTAWRPFLHHISKGGPQRRRTVGLRAPRKLPRVLTAVEVQTILDACDRLRDRFLLALLYDSGVRAGEALGLRHEDIAAAEREVTVRPRTNDNGARVKSRASRTIPVSAGLVRLYADYLHGEYGDLDSDYVFVNLWGHPRGHPLTYTAVYDLVRRLRRRTGIDFDLHWYRHTAATRLLRDGVPIEVVSKILGHAGLSTTLDVHVTPDGRRCPRGVGCRGLVHRPGSPAMTAMVPVPGEDRVRARRQAPAPRPEAGWDAEYARDIWRLRQLGIECDYRATIRFGGIPQPWLKTLAKRWARWRLATGLSPATAESGTKAIARFGAFLTTAGVGCLARVDRQLLERYLADLRAERLGTVTHSNRIGQLNAFFTAIRRHGWDATLPTTAVFFPEDYPERAERLPRALTELVMTQLEHPDSLDRWNHPVYMLITVILMRCGLRITDATGLPRDCIAHDGGGAPYLRYFNHKMKREALVPIDEELERQITGQQALGQEQWPGGAPLLFPSPQEQLRGNRPVSGSGYRRSLRRWLKRCDIRDDHGRPVHLTPHQWRHTLGTRLINRDVPQEVVRRILDHDSHLMTSHYARLSDTTIRRHWEQARKVNISGETVTLDPRGPLAEAAWAKQRLGRVTQALPNGYCGLPVQQSCPHANACLSCPMFITTSEFLPQHHQHRSQVIQIISGAEARGQQRLAEMNQQVLDNLNRIITALGQETTDAS